MSIHPSSSSTSSSNHVYPASVPQDKSDAPVIGIGIEIETQLGLIPTRNELNNKVVLAETDDRLLKLESETLGEKVKPGHPGVAEFVTGQPLRTADEALTMATHLKSFLLQALRDHKSVGDQPLSELIKKTDKWLPVEKNLKYSQPLHSGDSKSIKKLFSQNLQLTRSIPVEGIYRYLKGTVQTPQQQHLLNSAKQVADEYIAHYSKHDHSLKDQKTKQSVWQLVFLTAWMVASYILIETTKGLPKENLRKLPETPSKATREYLTKYHGKSFFDALPRFAPGDLLRSKDFNKEAKNHFQERFSSKGWYPTSNFLSSRIKSVMIDTFADEHLKGGSTIAVAKAVVDKPKKERIQQAVRSCLDPGYDGDSANRYPKDNADERTYGEVVDPTGRSICRSSTQFQPRLERLRPDSKDARLHVLFETRIHGELEAEIIPFDFFLRRFFSAFICKKISHEDATQFLELLFEAHRQEAARLSQMETKDSHVDNKEIFTKLDKFLKAMEESSSAELQGSTKDKAVVALNDRFNALHLSSSKQSGDSSDEENDLNATHQATTAPADNSPHLNWNNITFRAGDVRAKQVGVYPRY
jgi:hypothetical protein